MIYNIRRVADPRLADLVTMSDDYVQYRACPVCFSKEGKEKHLEMEFIRFVQSPEGASISAIWGWMAQ